MTERELKNLRRSWSAYKRNKKNETERKLAAWREFKATQKKFAKNQLGRIDM